MSNTIDQKVVEMRFDNGQFNNGIQSSMSFIDRLKQSLNFSGTAKSFGELSNAANGVNMSGLASGVETVHMKFSALQVVAVTALANIANAAINTGTNMVKALTIDPVMQGFSEYETKMNSIQTIMSNTASKGTTMSDVTRVIDELNTYADKTIYNFAEMTRNIGTFTAAGVALDPAAKAIQGIANLAAASGSNANQASTAMYQLSQALASGKVQLMDWNSVVNAGMGGEKFQNALKQTAREHGVAIDDIIAKQGSFRDSLQEGWLTADILNETLNNFTVDGAKKYAQSMMDSGKWTQAQADALINEAQAMEDAATKVKTFTQLWSTLKEAAQSGLGKTWEIIVGDFEEAKDLFTNVSNVIGGMINASSDARNNLLQSWKDMGGRAQVIDTIQNAFNGIMQIVNALGAAFREIFPPMTAEKLLGFTAGLKALSENFKLSDENATKLKSAFAGIFAVVDMVGKAFSSLFGVVGPTASILGSLAQVILDIAANIGNWLVGLDKAFTGMEKVGDGASTMKTKIQEAFKSASDNLANSKFLDGLSAIGDALMKIGGVMASGLGSLVGTMIQGLSNINFDAIVGALGAAGFGAIVAGIIKFVKNLSVPLEAFTGIAESVSGVLDQVRDSLKAYQNQINSKILLTIAVAVGILAASLFLLSGIDGAKLAAGLGAITVMLGELMLALFMFTKIGAIAKGAIRSVALLVGLAIAIAILAGAMKTLADLSWEGIAKGLVGVTVLMAELVIVAKVLSANGGTIVTGAASLILFAIAIKILASAVGDLAGLSWEELTKGLVGVGVLLAGIALFCNNAKFTASMIAAGAGILLLSVGLKILASAVGDLASLSWEGIAKGLVGIGVALAMLAVALNLMPPNMLFIGAGLLVAAVGIKILASALTSLGGLSWEQVAIGLVALGGALAILAIGLYAMTGTIAGSAALLIASVALALLAPSLAILSNLSWEGIAKGLVALAGTFLVFGLAAALLTPVIPSMLLLGAAILVLGVGVAALGAGLFLAGMGIQALAIGFGMLAGMTASGSKAVVDALTTIITGIVTLIPTVATALAEGLVAFSQVIISGAPIIAAAITAVISSLLTSLATIIPQGVQVFFQFITAICEALATYVPIIAQAFLTLILGILQVVATNIPLLIQAGVDIINAFVMGIATAIPQLVNAGFQAIIAFVNGLAEAIRSNTQPMIDAFNNLFSAMAEAGQAVLMNSVGGFMDAGNAIMNNGLISGISSMVGNLVSTVLGAIQSAASAAAGAVGNFFSVGYDMISGMVNGIVSGVGGLIDAAASAASSALNAAKNAVLSNSPSKRFMWLGEDCDEGMAIGFYNSARIVAKAAAKVATGSLNVMSNTISKLGGSIMDGIDSQPTIRPVMDLSGIQNGVKAANSLMGNNSMNIATTARINPTKPPTVNDILGSLDDVVTSTVNKVLSGISGESTTMIEVPINLDGKQIAKVTAPYVNNLLGVRTGLAARGQA